MIIRWFSWLGGVFRWLFWFGVTVVIYGLLATKGGRVIPESIDYYNLQAEAFLQGKLDVVPGEVKTDLSFYNGKWYLPFGPLPAVILAVIHVLLGVTHIPLIIITVIVAAAGVATSNIVLRRFGSPLLATFLTLVLAFGSQVFWVATRPGIWFQAHVYTLLIMALGFLVLLKKRYTLSTFILAANVLVRPTTGLWALLPIWQARDRLLKLMCVASVWVVIYFGYNYLRFGNIFENGFTYHQYNEFYAERVAKAGGWFSFRNVPYNAWFMFLEIPRLSWLRLEYNPEGNSVIFLMPVLLFTVMARKGIWAKKLWGLSLLIMLMVLRLSGTGWHQVGYRYVMDIILPLFVLIAIGVKGKLNGWLLIGGLWGMFVWTIAAAQGI